jgi:hypothetical protein
MELYPPRSILHHPSLAGNRVDLATTLAYIPYLVPTVAAPKAVLGLSGSR